jgi:hypothetical protein
VLLLTVPLAAFVSNSFPLSAVIASVSGADGFDLGPYFVLWQLAVTVLMIFVFYKVGERLDFFRSYRRLAVLRHLPPAPDYGPHHYGEPVFAGEP